MDKLLEQVTAKAQEWLGSSFDEKTREEVKALIEKEDKADLTCPEAETGPCVKELPSVE